MLSQHELEQLKDLLNRLGFSQISYDIQLAVQAKFVLAAIETVVFNKNGRVALHLRNGKNEIPKWRNCFASPGSMLRWTDKSGNSFPDAFRRVAMSELKISFNNEPQFAGYLVLPTDRGTELAMIHVYVTDEQPEHCTWHDPKNLPANILSHHPAIIGAANDYLARQMRLAV